MEDVCEYVDGKLKCEHQSDYIIWIWGINTETKEVDDLLYTRSSCKSHLELTLKENLFREGIDLIEDRKTGQEYRKLSDISG